MLHSALAQDLETLAALAAHTISQTERADAEGSRPAVHISSTIRHIECYLRRELRLRVLAREINAGHPLLALPVRALQRLFEHLDLTDRLALAYTCHSLRDAVFDIRSLWTSVRCEADTLHTLSPEAQKDLGLAWPQGVLRGVSSVLNLSFPLPARLSLRAPVTKELIDVVATHLHRLEALELKLFSFSAYNSIRGDNQAAVSDEHIDWVLDVLCVAAPFLRRLHLAGQDVGHDRRRAAPLRGDTSDAPASTALRHCTLRLASFPQGGCPALSSLTFFDYVVPTGILELQELEDILFSLPHLETLGLRLHTVINESPADPPVLMSRTLRKVAIDVHDPAFVWESIFFDNSNFVAAMDDLVDYFTHRPTVEILLTNNLPNTIPERMWGHIVRADMVSYWGFLLLENGSMMYMSKHILSLALNWQPDDFKNLRMLSLEIDHFFGGFHALAALEELCLIITRCVRCTQDEPPYHALRGTWQTPWQLPRLHVLSVMSPDICRNDQSSYKNLLDHVPCADACAVSALDVRNFVVSCLDYDPPRLRKLAFSGLHITEAEHVDFRELADEVLMKLFGSGDVFPLQPWVPRRLSRDEAGPAAAFEEYATSTWDVVRPTFDLKSSP